MTENESGEMRPRLSTAAENALDEAVDDIKKELVWRANVIANGPQGGDADAGVRDVVQALTEVSGRESVLRRRLRLLRVTTSAYGVLGVAFATFYFTTSNDSVSPSILFLSGILIGTSFGPLFLSLFESFSSKGSGLEDRVSDKGRYEILDAWIGLESAIRARYSILFGESRAHVSIGKMIADLREAGVIRERDVEKLMQLLSYRNDIAHMRSSDLPDLSARQVRDMVDSSRILRRRLREL